MFSGTAALLILLGVSPRPFQLRTLPLHQPQSRMAVTSLNGLFNEMSQGIGGRELETEVHASPYKNSGASSKCHAKIIEIFKNHLMCFSGIRKHGPQEKHLGVRLEREPRSPSPTSLLFLGPDFAGATQIHLCKHPLLTTSSCWSPVALTNKGDCCSHALPPSMPSFGIPLFLPSFSMCLSSLYTKPEATDRQLV